jgi:tetratricopeptide (TPR) repeat protein
VAKLQDCPDPRDPDRTIRGCSAAIASGHLSSEALAIVFYDRGNAFHRKRQYDQAISDLDVALRLRPNFADALNNRGNNYYAKHQYARAIRDYDEALRLQPTYVLALSNRGSAYLAEGNARRALQDFDRAVRLDPHFLYARHNRALALHMTGGFSGSSSP